VRVEFDYCGIVTRKEGFSPFRSLGSEPKTETHVCGCRKGVLPLSTFPAILIAAPGKRKRKKEGLVERKKELVKG